MEPSPLRQDERPTIFQPKIAQLYDDLFQPEDPDLVDTDGFWTEFFLLKPDKGALQKRLDGLHPDDLLQLQHESQQLFSRAVSQVTLNKAPLDDNALDVRLRINPWLSPATYLSDPCSLLELRSIQAFHKPERRDCDCPRRSRGSRHRFR